MERSKIDSKYLIIPISWHLIYLFLCESIDREYRVYFDLIFYLGLSIYFISIGSISIRELQREWRKGKKFWFQVICTMILIIIAYAIGSGISTLLPNIETGMNAFKVVNLPTLLAFAVTTIFLPTIAEEAFYRKGIINFNSRGSLILSALLGILLYASEHSLKPLGFIIAVIWALPFTISYIKTKNIYIPMTAHFICNLVFNGFTSISMLGYYLK